MIGVHKLVQIKWHIFRSESCHSLAAGGNLKRIKYERGLVSSLLTARYHGYTIGDKSNNGQDASFDLNQADVLEGE